MGQRLKWDIGLEVFSCFSLYHGSDIINSTEVGNMNSENDIDLPPTADYQY